MQELAGGPLDEEQLLQRRKEKQKDVKKAQKSLINKMMDCWTSQ